MVWEDLGASVGSPSAPFPGKGCWAETPVQFLRWDRQGFQIPLPSPTCPHPEGHTSQRSAWLPRSQTPLGHLQVCVAWGRPHLKQTLSGRLWKRGPRPRAVAQSQWTAARLFLGAVWAGVSAWAERACGGLSAPHWPRGHEDQQACPSGRQALRHPVWSGAALAHQPTAAQGGGGCGRSRPSARAPSSVRGMGTGLRSLCPAWSGPHVPVPMLAGQVCRPGVGGGPGPEAEGLQGAQPPPPHPLWACPASGLLERWGGGLLARGPPPPHPASPTPILPWYRPVSTGSDLGWPLWSF